MQIIQITDPRDKLQRARRSELVDYAERNGIKEVSASLPADKIREIFRQKGIYSIPIPNRVLGDYSGNAYASGEVAVEATDSPAPAVAQAIDQKQDAINKFVADMSMTELRRECKRLGIKMVRTDNLKTLREKLGNQNTP